MYSQVPLLMWLCISLSSDLDHPGLSREYASVCDLGSLAFGFASNAEPKVLSGRASSAARSTVPMP